MLLKIGELARASGCEVETIRYYEKQGLLPKPVRTAAGYRLYQPQQLDQLKFIRHCRAFGMSLATISQLLEARARPDSSCLEVNQLIDDQLQRLDDQLQQLQGLRQGLLQLREQCRHEHQVKDCEILKNLVHPCPPDCQSHR